MSTIVQQCGDPEPDDICERIHNAIMKLVFQKKSECGERGLIERIMDQIYGMNGPGTSIWEGHVQQISQLKTQIKKLLKDFGDNNCGGRTPIGVDVKYWINRKNPTPDEWKGPAQQVPTKREIFEWEYWKELTGLSGAALVIYILVSEGSRIVPVRNLIPVP